MAESDPKNTSRPSVRKKLGELLIAESVITESVLRQALAEQKVTGQRLGDLLVERGWAASEQINLALASQMETEVANLGDYIVEKDVLSLVNEHDAREFKVVPLFLSENILYLATPNPNDIVAIDYIRDRSGCKVKTLLASEADVSWAIEQHYRSSGTVEEVLSAIDHKKLLAGDREQEANVIRLVNLMISKAVHDKASDIHIEPEEKVVNIRYCIDGVLHKRHVAPKLLQAPIISRTKILSALDISEKRLPQDGRLRMKIEAKEIDFRVSTCPSVHGENIVLRVLDKSGLVVGLKSLGFSDNDLTRFKEMIELPYGIILVTGPTGSGKTTTLYSALQLLNKEDVNIMTVEDPVEYQFHGMRQVQVHSKIGLNFSGTLRSFLRQDPDIIMVGEIRDLETAEIAIQAALTGHLVFSTLHTNDAPTAFNRLIDMGVEPFLVSSSLLGVLAQRLVRKICSKCKEAYTPTPEVIASLKLKEKLPEGAKFYRGKGCTICGNTGYKGRLGIYELLRTSSTLQAAILRKESAENMRKIAIEGGMSVLRNEALNKLFSGITTVDEVFRVT